MVREREARLALIKDVPAQNFREGLLTVNLPPRFDPKISGKVRDIWAFDDRLAIVSTDRNTAYDSVICTVPDSGVIINEISNWWKKRIAHLMDTDYLSSPNQNTNLTIVKKAAVRFDVEFVFRRFLEKSASRTSLYHKYRIEGRRNIYGIDFPDDLIDNQELPMGAIFTPTTKAADGQHDMEITEEEAREKVDTQANKRGTFDRIKPNLVMLFGMGTDVHKARGLYLPSTKYEVGLDKDGTPMVIDEIHTPHSSRIWIAGTYQERFEKGRNPESLDKEILRVILNDAGYTGDGPIPKLKLNDIRSLVEAYARVYFMITRERPPRRYSAEEITGTIVRYFQDN